MTQLIKKILLVISVITVFLFTIQGKAVAQGVTTYEQAIQKADKQFAAGHYMDAKGYYQMALKYKKDDPYSKKKINELIDKMSHQMDKEDEYYDIIDKADIYYDQNAFDKALIYYRDALKVIPDDDYAGNRVQKILDVKANEKARLENFKKMMADGSDFLNQNKFDEAIDAFSTARALFPNNPDPVDKITAAQELKADYENRMLLFNEKTEEAGRYLLIKKYANALKLYQEAQKLFPENKAVAKKIEELTPKAKTQLAYDELLAVADELYINKNFGAAKAKYAEAAKLWPENSYPADMIARIDNQLALQRKDLDKNYRLAIASADSLFGIEDYQSAIAEYNLALTLKPGEQYPQSKLDVIDGIYAKRKAELQAQYGAIITKADSLFAALAIDDARKQYELALSIRPDDKYPAGQLKAIEEKAAELAAAQEKKRQYDAIIAEADRLYKQGHFELAIKKYKEAQVLGAISDYPTNRIEEITMVMLNARKAKEIDENYNKQVLLGTRLKQQENYVEARKAFMAAADLKPAEQMPKDQIAEIDQLLLAREQQAVIDTKFKAKMKSADSLLALKDYENAKLAYQDASNLKPKETKPKLQITKIETIVASLEREAKQKKSYDAAISSGDDYFSNRRYEEAKVQYQKALTIKPNETYPQQQISRIDKLLEQLAEERARQYQETVVKADNYFEQSKYQDALLQYKIASSLKPGDQHCQSRIETCNTEIDARLRKIKGEYDLAVADADKLYASKIFDKAIKGYRKAEKIKPDETYPQEMITKITKFIEENSVVDVINTTTIINRDESKKFTFEPVRINVRKYNYILVRVTNVDASAGKLLFTYGSDKGKNGGFVISLVPEVGSNDYLIRVGNQYKWFSEDNNWINILSQNANVEISLVRISKTN
jgi:tetratricopeptide (TPR) repeat protein